MRARIRLRRARRGFSAVKYLHKQLRMAHRDIKLSSILVYHDSSSSGLKAKITDFGLAIGFDRVKLFNPGTKELQSAVNHNAPELRRRNCEEVFRERQQPTPATK